MKKINNDNDSLPRLIRFLNSLQKPYCIHAGFALHLRGFDSEIDDIDVKVFSDLDEIFISAKRFFGSKVRLSNPKPSHFGSYLFPHSIEIDISPAVDICNRTGVLNDLGRVEFPYSMEVFTDIEYFDYQGTKVPVASLEQIFLYYLVLRRDKSDQKNDRKRIKDILNSNKFNERKFKSLLRGHAKEKEIMELYEAQSK